MWICFRKKIKSWLIYQIDSVFSVSVHALSIFCNDWSTHFQASSLKPRTFAESKVPLIDLVHICRIECSNIKSVHSNVLFSTIFPGVTKFQTRGPYLDLTPPPSRQICQSRTRTPFVSSRCIQCNCHSPTQHELELDLIMGKNPPPRNF